MSERGSYLGEISYIPLVPECSARVLGSGALPRRACPCPRSPPLHLRPVRGPLPVLLPPFFTNPGPHLLPGSWSASPSSVSGPSPPPPPSSLTRDHTSCQVPGRRGCSPVCCIQGPAHLHDRGQGVSGERRPHQRGSELPAPLPYKLYPSSPQLGATPCLISVGCIIDRGFRQLAHCNPCLVLLPDQPRNLPQPLPTPPRPDPNTR